MGTLDACPHSVRTLFSLLIGGLIGCGSAPQAERGRAPRIANESGLKQVRFSGGLDLVVLGSGGPRSAGRAASSYLIAVDGEPRMLVDVGSGSFTRLGEAGLAGDSIDLYLLTHLHIDHVGDLPDVVKSRYLSSRSALTFRIFGPSGRGAYPATTEFINRLFGSDGAFAYLPTFRNKVDLVVTDVSAEVGDGPHEILDEAGVIVSAVAVDHGDTPALAYRIEYRDRSVVISGDLASKSHGIEKLAEGATVLVYGAAVLDPPASRKSLYELHTPPHRIGEVAARAGVHRLILGHVSPATEKRSADVLASVSATFKGDVRFATDGMHVPLHDARVGDP
jgi:ribonuclease BN (tRNA processing enzyme)